MKALITFFCLLSISLTSWSAAAVKMVKKNACTVTINSSEEADLFKSHLSPEQWNFTELAPKDAASASKHWFAEACKPEVKCDILIVSGHFGGTFFGSSKLTLSMEDLERQSCDQKCDGILKQPKEVFLFGCNTLASKQKDHRTPELYMQTLLDDGFSAAQASQMVSFRYSDFGDSFKHSMSQVFAATPRIYGFSSVGPSGKTIAPLLKNYLVATKSEYQNFDAFNRVQATKLNQKLYTALKNTSFAQAQGLILNIKSAEEKPYCYIASQKVNRINKLKYIQKLFESKKAVQLLGHIQGFLHEVKLNLTSLTNEEKKIWNSFVEDPKLKTDLVGLLKLKGDVYLPLKENILNTIKDLDLVSDAFVTASYTQLLDLHLPYSQLRMQNLCAVGSRLNIAAAAIPDQRYKDVFFISSLLCLRPEDPQIQLKLLEVIKSSADLSLRSPAVWYFYWVRPSDAIQEQLANLLIHEKDEIVRQSMAMAFRQIRPDAEAVRALIEKALHQEKNQYIGVHLTESLKAANE